MSRPFPQSENFAGDEEEAAHYQKMWRGVLLQALGEADGIKRRLLGLAKNAKSRETWRARRWLTEDSQDLREVCSFAGFDFKVLLEYARRRYGGRKHDAL